MQLKDYELGDIRDWSSLIFVRVYSEDPYQNGAGKSCLKRIPRGFVFVTDPKFGSRAQWKLPAGHKVRHETPLDTAVRELIGETNLAPEVSAFQYQGKWLGRQGDHWKCLFSADVHERELGWMNSSHPGNEGEEPKYFDSNSFLSIVREGKFMREHFKKLVEFALVLPGPELEAVVQQHA